MGKDITIKKIVTSDIENELANIGYDSSYAHIGANKFRFINLKLFSLSLPQANILKQTALAFGADCAVHHDVLTANVENTDCILGGSFSQIKKISESIKKQPFSMSLISKKLECFLKSEKNILPKIVGILNLTENSFSDGGKYIDFDNAIKHLHEMIDEGADIIDIGAESTKPFAQPISASKQMSLIEPVLGYINKNNIDIPISIDTRSSEVAQKTIEMGASIINDVSGFDFDSKMVDIVSNYDNVKVIIQHSQGNPTDMQINPVYNSVVDEIYLALKNKIELAVSKNISIDNIIIDVGIGFGKTKEHNFELIKRIQEFQSLECEIMLGTSRKSLLDMKDEPNEIKDVFTVALNALAIERNVNYLRVHNVLLHKKLIDLMKNF